MPTNRRFRRKERRPEIETLSIDLRRDLLHGSGFIVREHSEDVLRAAWKLHRDDLRRQWQEAEGPGSRCFAEWLLEIVPKFGERRTTQWWTDGHQQFRDNWLTHGILHTCTVPASQEPEHEYLLRNGLIAQAEFDQAEAEYAETREFEAEMSERMKQLDHEESLRRKRGSW